MSQEEFLKQLNKLGIAYDLDINTNYNYIRLGNGVDISIRNKYPQRFGLFTSSAGDLYDIVFRVGDRKENAGILGYLRARGYRELNDWRCAQWGTWKFKFNIDMIAELHNSNLL